MSLAIQTPPVELETLVRDRAVGYSLAAPFYTSQEIFDLDLVVIFGRHWLFSAVTAEIPDPGDYLTIDIGPYAVIIVRDDDEEIRAFHNVCRHRGSRLLKDPCGSVGNIVCPYHQWTYRPDGDLIFAEAQPDTFDKSRFGLKPVHVKVVAGLIFTCLADDPPDDFDEIAEFLEPYLAPYELAGAKVAHQTDLIEEGNWKLVMENNRECQHCDGAHPELVSAYFPLFGYSEDDITPRMRPAFERFQAATADLERVCSLRGFPQEERRELDTRATGFQLCHLALDGQGISFAEDGAQVCKKLIGAMTEPRFGDLSLHVQPNSWFHFLSDHAVVFRVLPISPTKSIVRSTWLVHPDAVEGVDYDVDSLTAVWEATNREDRELVTGTQNGVTNPGYIPGPYSLVEDDVEAFVNWYITRLQHHVEAFR